MRLKSRLKSQCRHMRGATSVEHFVGATTSLRTNSPSARLSAIVSRRAETHRALENPEALRSGSKRHEGQHEDVAVVCCRWNKPGVRSQTIYSHQGTTAAKQGKRRAIVFTMTALCHRGGRLSIVCDAAQSRPGMVPGATTPCRATHPIERGGLCPTYAATPIAPGSPRETPYRP